MIDTKRAATVTETKETLTVHMHTHEFYEIYFPIFGDIDYHIEGRTYTLKPKDLIFAKKGESHSIIVNTLVPYETLYVHFSEDAILGTESEKERIRNFLDSKPLGEHNCFSSAQFKDTNWQHYLRQIWDAKENSQKQAYLTVLLYELMDAYPKVSDPVAQNDQIVQIIRYINDHLTEPLTLTQICSQFYISKPQLYRKFKRATNSSVWEYIIAKRLVLAHDLLGQGTPPTEVYLRCGFSDYSWFYRVYKAKFHVSPKASYRRNKTNSGR